MADGIRVKLAVDVATVCPVAELSGADAGEAGTSPTVRDVTWAQATDGTVTEEFRVDADVADDSDAVPGADPVMEVGSERVYQFTRDADTACACDIVERLDCPIADVHATDGTLLLTLYLPDIDRLREVVAALDDVTERVSVRYLVRSNADAGDGRDTVVVDRGALTQRQAEVLRTAYRLGYFEYRSGANASQVAEALDITDSTLAEHLSKAQSELLAEVFRTTAGTAE
jgi:predicted DNA binding protein